MGTDFAQLGNTSPKLWRDHIGTQSEGAAFLHGRNSQVDPKFNKTGRVSGVRALSDEFNVQHVDQVTDFTANRNT